MKKLAAITSFLIFGSVLAVQAEEETRARIVCVEKSSWNDDERVVVVDQMSTAYTVHNNVEEVGNMQGEELVSFSYNDNDKHRVVDARMQYFNGKLSENYNMHEANDFVNTRSPESNKIWHGKMARLETEYRFRFEGDDEMSFILSIYELKFGTMTGKLSGDANSMGRWLTCIMPFAIPASLQ